MYGVDFPSDDLPDFDFLMRMESDVDLNGIEDLVNNSNHTNLVDNNNNNNNNNNNRANLVDNNMNLVDNNNNTNLVDSHQKPFDFNRATIDFDDPIPKSAIHLSARVGAVDLIIPVDGRLVPMKLSSSVKITDPFNTYINLDDNGKRTRRFISLDGQRMVNRKTDRTIVNITAPLSSPTSWYVTNLVLSEDGNIPPVNLDVTEFKTFVTNPDNLRNLVEVINSYGGGV
jgi:hypothetical protein